MNKKYTTLAIAGLLAFNTVAFGLSALTADQEKARLATLWNLKANNALTIAQFVESGHSTAAIIDRDIALLEKDIAQVLQQKAWAEGFISNRMIPGIFKGISICFGAASVVGLTVSALAFIVAWDVRNRGYSDVSNVDVDKAVSQVVAAAPTAAMTSLIYAGISRYASKRRSSLNVENANFIQETQERANTNRAIIAVLKQLKYDNGL